MSAEPGPEAEEVAPLPEWAEGLVRLLDDGATLPGTKIKFGLDPILGFLIPGGGDGVTGATSVALLVLAIRQRVPTVVLLRMVYNIGVDVFAGAVPIAGDLFDVYWKSNRKNLELIREHGERHAPPRVVDYLLVGFGVVLAVLGVLLPIAVVYFLGSRLFDWLGG